jgi:hypothetical protein
MSKGQVQFKDVKLPSDKQRAETDVEASGPSTTGSKLAYNVSTVLQSGSFLHTPLLLRAARRLELSMSMSK